VSDAPAPAFDDVVVDDEMFDIAAVEAGAWAPSPYGPGDQRGTFNEVTPETTRRALALLGSDAPVQTYSLGEDLREGFPAWGTRTYVQRLVVTGYQPKHGFKGELVDPAPQGRGRSSVNEERVSLTYNMGTKVNGLHHVGVADMFYNGFRGPEIAETSGTSRLGAETVGPIVTRGVLVDLVGAFVGLGRDESVETAPSGRPMLRANYRVTVEDIESTLRWEDLSSPLEPGDAVLLRTGWRELLEDDPTRYLEGGPPGPYLRECRHLARRRPALIGSDSWCFENVDPVVTNGYVMACHQELSGRFGIRIGEAVRTDDLAEVRAYEFVFCFNPLAAVGAVASNSPPLALAVPETRRPGPSQHEEN
jgi:kynurenine formamidase